MHVLIVDNFDSFTNNVAHYLRLAPGVDTVSLIKNNDFSEAADALLSKADAIILSPGPGNVANQNDIGICQRILDDDQRPILGVCLGHQAIAHQAGVKVSLAEEPIHGRVWSIHHSGEGLLSGITTPLKVVRYHSWIVEGPLPHSLKATAWADDEIMAIEHSTLPRWGVQFHPESIGTEEGHKIFENFIKLASDWKASNSSKQSLLNTRHFAYTELTDEHKLIGLTEALRVNGKSPALLESAMIKGGLSRYSYLGADFGIQGETLSYDQSSKTLSITKTDGEEYSLKTELAQFFRTEMAKLEYQQAIPDFKFRGGFIGWFGYELQEEFTGVKAASHDGQSAAFSRVNTFFVIDHKLGKTFAAVNVAQANIDCADDVLRQMVDFAASLTDVAEFKPGRATKPIAFTPRHNDHEYLNLIRDCKNSIGLGESYELCLTNQITAPADGVDPWELYKLLRQRNACPFAAYLEIGETTIVSSSPERFISVDEEGNVTAKPIKGTIRRGLTGKEDADLKSELLKSEKDRAENLMIVDLLRHDLSAVCDPGTVLVPKLMAIETYPKVHQLVSTVTGQLAHFYSGIDAFEACFPGGSMTGAPKIRSMEILRELENGPRGVYSGSIGWVGYDGQLDQSIVIRTVVFENNEMSIGCGGAITYLSDPLSELEEIKLKAQALLNCIAEVATGDPEKFILAGSTVEPDEVVIPENEGLMVS